MRTASQRVTFTLAGALMVGTMALSAPPTKSVKPTSKKPVVEQLTIERPAVPYVALQVIRDHAVHEELKLNPKQIQAVQEAISKVDERFWQLREAPPQEGSAELNQLHIQLQSSLKRELTSSQLERLDQIVYQARGWPAILAPEIVDRLKLNADQVSRLQLHLANLAKRRSNMDAAMGTESVKDSETTRTKALMAETKQFAEILSASQQNELSAAFGKPFDLSRITPVGCVAPELRGVSAWINSRPITLRELRGKVVLVHFWAFSCINCIRNLPHYQRWNEKYAESGLTIIGIHTPETDAERLLENLQRQVLERKIRYPVVFDEESANWKAWGNNLWPSVYLIDKEGRVRNWWYGELNWNDAKGDEFISQRIEALLAEK